MNHRRVSTATLLSVLCLFVHASGSQASDPPQGGGDDFRAAAVSHGATAADPDHAGIWKGAVPLPGTTRGEFDNNDPVGLSAGESVKADCSVNWVDPDSGKRYCFSTSTSLVSFLTAPHDYLARASAAWNKLKSGAGHSGGG
jgi:YHS domain-containing protein